MSRTVLFFWSSIWSSSRVSAMLSLTACGIACLVLSSLASGQTDDFASHVTAYKSTNVTGNACFGTTFSSTVHCNCCKLTLDAGWSCLSMCTCGRVFGCPPAITWNSSLIIFVADLTFSDQNNYIGKMDGNWTVIIWFAYSPSTDGFIQYI